MAMGTCTTKLIHSTASGENGMPSAIEKIAAPRKLAMKPTSAAIWKRMYFDEVVVELAAVLDRPARWWRSCRR